MCKYSIHDKLNNYVELGHMSKKEIILNDNMYVTMVNFFNQTIKTNKMCFFLLILMMI